MSLAVRTMSEAGAVPPQGEGSAAGEEGAAPSEDSEPGSGQLATARTLSARGAGASQEDELTSADQRPPDWLVCGSTPGKAESKIQSSD